MKKIFANMLLVLAVATSLQSCAANGSKAANAIGDANEQTTANGRDKVKTVEHKLAYFNTLDVNVTCDVYFTQGNKQSVRIVGSAKDVDAIKVSVDKDNRLKVTSRKSNINDIGFFGRSKRQELKIYITSADLIAVNLLGQSDFKVLSTLDTDNLDISLSGMGDMDFDKRVVCDNLNIQLRGAGDVEFDNVTAQKATVEIYGTGDIDMHLHKVANTDITVKGTGDIDAHFDNCGAAACTLYGTGDIKLKGSLRSLSQKKYGTGSIDTDDLRVGGSR